VKGRLHDRQHLVFNGAARDGEGERSPPQHGMQGG
jgi:hypothetical protein